LTDGMLSSRLIHY